jgi:hypothetical protein
MKPIATLATALFVLAFAAPAFAQSNTAQPNTAQPNTSQPRFLTSDTSKTDTSKMSPKDVCQKFAQLAQNQSAKPSDFAPFVYKPEGGHHEKHAMQGKGHGQWMQQFANADCSNETIAGDHAFVVAKSSSGERLLPFIKDNGSWKLDAGTYHAMYRMEHRMPASGDMNKQ